MLNNTLFNKSKARRILNTDSGEVDTHIVKLFSADAFNRNRLW